MEYALPITVYPYENYNGNSELHIDNNELHDPEMPLHV